MHNFNFRCKPKQDAGIRIGSMLDIALMKLMAVANRVSPKDVYDLDYITNDLPLSDFMRHLDERRMDYYQEEHRTIFDLDGEVSPLDQPLRLLEFGGLVATAVHAGRVNLCPCLLASLTYTLRDLVLRRQPPGRYRAAERCPALDPMAQLRMLIKQERKAAFGNTEPTQTIN